MTITDLKAKYNERLIQMAAAEIVIAGLGRIASEDARPGSPLAEDMRKCFDDINNSSWDDIRAIIKRSL